MIFSFHLAADTRLFASLTGSASRARKRCILIEAERREATCPARSCGKPVALRSLRHRSDAGCRKPGERALRPARPVEPKEDRQRRGRSAWLGSEISIYIDLDDEGLRVHQCRFALVWRARNSFDKS